jgi:formyltetrahydrofolate deformylase
MSTAVFLVSCPDRKGLISKISTFFFERSFNIVDCQQHTSEELDYFMRMVLDLGSSAYDRAALEKEFGEFARGLDLSWSVHYSDTVQKVAVLVTKTSHCLYDLLVRVERRELPCEIPLIIGNHPDLESVAEKFKVPFHHLPVTKDTKPEQEAKILDLLRAHHIDLVVLARYMQVVSADFIRVCRGNVINIHHAALPAFQGAKPYERAYERGVKLIGATAHYATAELDEGPIIEQDVEPVTHEMSVEDLRRIGADIERVVLARAVQAHLERRIIVNRGRTVLFP